MRDVLKRTALLAGPGVDRNRGIVPGWNGDGFQYSVQAFGFAPASAGSSIGRDAAHGSYAWCMGEIRADAPSHRSGGPS